MTLYEKIEKLCNNAGFPISRLPEKVPGLTISKASISGWKTGSKPRTDKLKAIADYFGMSVEYLLSEDQAVSTGNVQDNHGIIGNTHAPVTIVNGAEQKPSAQEAALLELFNQMDVIKQAQLLAYAAELVK